MESIGAVAVPLGAVGVSFFSFRFWDLLYCVQGCAQAQPEGPPTESRGPPSRRQAEFFEDLNAKVGLPLLRTAFNLGKSSLKSSVN